MNPYLRVNVEVDQPGRGVRSVDIVSAVLRAAKRQPQSAGFRLPPVRILAHQLGVSKNTVAAAYDELVARGTVESTPRRGIFLCGASRPSDAPRAPIPPNPKLLSPSMDAQVSAARPGVDLSRVFIDPALLPRDKLAVCFRSVLRLPGIHTFYDAQGYLPLRQAIAERVRRRGIPARAEHVIITTGSQQALDIACRALVDKSIATENPAYALGKRLFEMNALRVTGLAFNPFQGIDLPAWSRQLRTAKPSLLYLTTNFQNPTGYSLSTEESSRILALANELPMGILEDDWGSDMLPFSEYRPPLRALGGSNVLYMNSFTKKLLPAIRIGYLLANDQTVGALVEAKRVSTLGNPTLMEAALSEFLDRGYYDVHLKRLQESLDQRYQLCLKLLRQHMPDGVQWTTPGGGPLLWVQLPSQVDVTSLQRRLKPQRISISSSSSSFFGPPHLHGFKLGYAFPTPKELGDSIPKLARAIRAEMELG
jgi:DNA-binding transcriptional MocR family regulator